MHLQIPIAIAFSIVLTYAEPSLVRPTRLNRRCDNHTETSPASSASLPATLQLPPASDVPCYGYDCPTAGSPPSLSTSLIPDGPIASVSGALTSSTNDTAFSPGATLIPSASNTLVCAEGSCSEITSKSTFVGTAIQNSTSTGPRQAASTQSSATVGTPAGTSVTGGIDSVSIANGSSSTFSSFRPTYSNSTFTSGSTIPSSQTSILTEITIVLSTPVPSSAISVGGQTSQPSTASTNSSASGTISTPLSSATLVILRPSSVVTILGNTSFAPVGVPNTEISSTNPISISVLTSCNGNTCTGLSLNPTPSAPTGTVTASSPAQSLTQDISADTTSLASTLTYSSFSNVTSAVLTSISPTASGSLSGQTSSTLGTLASISSSILFTTTGPSSTGRTATTSPASGINGTATEASSSRASSSSPGASTSSLSTGTNPASSTGTATVESTSLVSTAVSINDSPSSTTLSSLLGASTSSLSTGTNPASSTGTATAESTSLVSTAVSINDSPSSTTLSSLSGASTSSLSTGTNPASSTGTATAESTPLVSTAVSINGSSTSCKSSSLTDISASASFPLSSVLSPLGTTASTTFSTSTRSLEGGAGNNSSSAGSTTIGGSAGPSPTSYGYGTGYGVPPSSLNTGIAEMEEETARTLWEKFFGWLKKNNKRNDDSDNENYRQPHFSSRAVPKKSELGDSAKV